MLWSQPCQTINDQTYCRTGYILFLEFDAVIQFDHIELLNGKIPASWLFDFCYTLCYTDHDIAPYG